jgi:ABC-type glycerol-3-phosphate transport system substrate-binding protein
MSPTSDRDDPREAARRAADLLRAQLPPLPPELDDRVLAAVAAEREAAAAAHRWRRRRAWAGVAAVLRPRFALAATALALVAIAVWGVSLRPLASPEEAAAVVVGPLPADCRTPAGEDPNALEVAAVWNGAEGRAFTKVLQRFERETGIPVVYHYETRNIAPKLRARVARGCPPDVALLPQPGLMAELAREGALQPLDASAAALVRQGYSPTWRRLGSVDGRLYGVWFKASDKSTLWYRPEALAAAGVADPPATWDALLRDGARIAASGVRPLAIAGADGWTLTDWFENVYLRGAGAERYDQLARHEIAWTDPSVVNALRRLGGLLGDAAIAGSPDQVRSTTFEASVREALGPDPSAAMVYEADFVRSFLGRRGSGSGASEPAFADFPRIGDRGGDGIVVGGDVAVRFSRSSSARRLIRFLATPRAAAAWARAGGYLSPNRNVPPSVYPDALTGRAAVKLSLARTVRFDLSDLQPPAFGATAGRGMWALFQELAADPGSATEIARRLEADARASGAGG